MILTSLVYTRLWLVIMIETIRIQSMGCHVHSDSIMQSMKEDILKRIVIWRERLHLDLWVEMYNDACCMHVLVSSFCASASQDFTIILIPWGFVQILQPVICPGHLNLVNFFNVYNNFSISPYQTMKKKSDILSIFLLFKKNFFLQQC